jgi:hypothetical protein
MTVYTPLHRAAASEELATCSLYPRLHMLSNDAWHALHDREKTGTVEDVYCSLSSTMQGTTLFVTYPHLSDITMCLF